MVFSSVPLFVDLQNWQQHPNYTHLQGGANETHHLPPPQPGGSVTGGRSPTSRPNPNSVAERARQAKIQQPDGPLSCPRCESTNTKFCYFNNYSLTQPRHFCKTCRRYWTRGGSLRNVPVGGGYRRNNKRNSKHMLKSPAKTAAATDQVGPTHHLLPPAPETQLSFMASLQSMTSQLGVGQFQQLPLLEGFRVGLPSNASHPFQNERMGIETASYCGKGLGVSQLAPVKMEENPRAVRLSLSKQEAAVAENFLFAGGSSGGLWTELA